MVLQRDRSSYMERAALGDGLGGTAAPRAVVDAVLTSVSRDTEVAPSTSGKFLPEVTRNAGVTLRGRYAAVTTSDKALSEVGAAGELFNSEKLTGTSGKTDVSFRPFLASIYIGG